MQTLRLLALGAAILCGTAASAEAPNPERLSTGDVAILRSILKVLDPLIEQRKKDGTAPLTVFEEMYAPLDGRQKALLDQIRGVRPETLQGSSRKLPLPSQEERFVRLDGQLLFRDGGQTGIEAQFLPEAVYRDYRLMMAAMEEELGKRLLVESGYRSPAYQLYLFIFYMPKHGYSIRETNLHVALPGCSEHGSPSYQAIDFITPAGINGEDRPVEFEELQEYGWLLARAREYGFHLSYPRGGSSAFEPWHWHWEQQRDGS